MAEYDPQAFPTSTSNRGMSLRDYFAAKAMQAAFRHADSYSSMAAVAYRTADAMMVHRRQNPPKEPMT